MARDDLIEQLAEHNWSGGVTYGIAFHELTAGTQAMHRDKMLRVWPLIVEFVAAWLILNEQDCYNDGELVSYWREDMA